ncbi:hypothetical protein BT67DRAFT_444672 [Trichocladium antarcticum]|uniref:Uncharacterized protein n=1 Tax=Trichocladium antarcticum TaxID=1450529 RepID=A0AAN6UE83_9PEZI|nr:hypothetical protein BT67DRAFT_444672 [Trichocladium antarcticum]
MPVSVGAAAGPGHHPSATGRYKTQEWRALAWAVVGMGLRQASPINVVCVRCHCLHEMVYARPQRGSWLADIPSLDLSADTSTWEPQPSMSWRRISISMRRPWCHGRAPRITACLLFPSPEPRPACDDATQESESSSTKQGCWPTVVHTYKGSPGYTGVWVTEIRRWRCEMRQARG